MNMKLGFAALLFAAVAACGADDPSKALNDEAAALMKDKQWAGAAEKFIAAAAAQPQEPRRLAGGFEQALRSLGRSKNTNEVAQAESLAEKALAIPGLSASSRVKIQQVRISVLPVIDRKKEALAIAQDLLDARIDVVATASAGAEANAYNSGTAGRAPWFSYLERILDNPGRYGLEGAPLKKLIGEYDGSNGGWGGRVIDRPRLEKAEQYYEKYGFGKITPNRLAEMREMDEHFPLPESELHIPNDLRDFGFDPNRKVVHAKDFAGGWNKDDATACLTEAINSDASTVIVDDMGSPWYVKQIKITGEKGSNKQIVFKKGVKVLAFDKPFSKGNLFHLDGHWNRSTVSNICFIGEGELGKDVYIGQFPSREARFATGISYGGSGFGGHGKNVLVKNLWVANNLDDGFCMTGSYHYLVDCILDDNFRQGLSVVWSDHGVYKNVTFCRTVGGEPHNGFDLEPVYESYSCPWHYFLNCKFFDNAAGSVVLSASNYAPTTLYFKDCEFAAGRYRNISVLARLGVYVGPVVEAPSKIIFEGCRIDGHSDAATLLWNTMIFNMQFKKCVFTEKGQLDPTRKPNMPPIFLSLDRGYWDGFYPKAGKVNFEDCTFNGWTNSPLIAVADNNGKLGINTFSGIVDHNGKEVDLSKFQYMPAERSLKDAAEPDLKTLDLAATEAPAPSFQFDFSAPWYHPMPTYSFLVKGEKGGKATLKLKGIGSYAAWTLFAQAPSGAERELGQIQPGDNSIEIAFAEGGVHKVYGVFKSNGSEVMPKFEMLGATGTAVSYFAGDGGPGVGRRIQINTPADKPRFVGYFEVKGGQGFNFKIMGGGIEFLDETGKSVAKLDEGEYFGTKCVYLRPAKDAIWSFRALTPSVKFRFFAPQLGLFAEKPELLAVTRKDLPFTGIEPIPAPELKDEPPLPLPEKIADEVAQLAAARIADAQKGLWAKRLAEAEANLARMKAELTDNNDGLRREIDDVTRTVERLGRHAAAEAAALKETEEMRTMAVVCAKWASTVAPEWMWCISTKDGVFTYPDERTLRSLYNEIVRRLSR